MNRRGLDISAHKLPDHLTATGRPGGPLRRCSEQIREKSGFAEPGSYRAESRRHARPAASALAPGPIRESRRQQFSLADAAGVQPVTYTFKLARRLASNHRLASVAVLCTLAACGGGSPTGSDSTPPPVTATSGWLTVQLATPNSDDGAVQFVISGPGVDSVRTVSPYTGHAAVSVSGTGHLVITGSIASGVVARVWVRDVTKASQVTASVRAAAVRTTYSLQDVSAYRALVVR